MQSFPGNQGHSFSKFPSLQTGSSFYPDTSQHVNFEIKVQQTQQMGEQKTSLTTHFLAFTGLSNVLSFAAVQFCSSHLSVIKYTSLTITLQLILMEDNLCFQSKCIIHITRDGNSGTTKKAAAKKSQQNSTCELLCLMQDTLLPLTSIFIFSLQKAMSFKQVKLAPLVHFF